MWKHLLSVPVNKSNDPVEEVTHLVYRMYHTSWDMDVPHSPNTKLWNNSYEEFIAFAPYLPTPQIQIPRSWTLSIPKLKMKSLLARSIATWWRSAGGCLLQCYRFSLDDGYYWENVEDDRGDGVWHADPQRGSWVILGENYAVLYWCLWSYTSSRGWQGWNVSVSVWEAILSETHPGWPLFIWL